MTCDSMAEENYYCRLVLSRNNLLANVIGQHRDRRVITVCGHGGEGMDVAVVSGEWYMK